MINKILNMTFRTSVLPLTIRATAFTMLALPIVAFSQSEQTLDIDEKHHSARGKNDKGNSAYATLDGSDNNRQDKTLGASGTLYSRIAPADYADGLNAIYDGPDLRYVSNRIFADGAQNLFSENSVTQWAYNWGQFIDHTIGLRVIGSEEVEVLFDESDPLENFNNSSQNFTITRSASAPDSGVDSPREQINTVSSYIDGWAIYGGTEERLEWLREGPIDGDMSNNGAKLLLTEQQHLPPASFRGDASSAPAMERMGVLRGLPNADDIVVITGDMRANENIALTAVQTLFAREHNRNVDLLPSSLSEQDKFDIARQMVIATQQYITYNEFLPAVGVFLDRANGYQSDVDPSVSHEFATVGYRAHSMIHGEIEIEESAARYSGDQLAGFRAQGIEVELGEDEVEIAVPLNIAFANPRLATSLGIGSIAAALGGEPQYKNDETFDNQLRSVLFQIPNPAIEDPDSCLDGITLPECYLLANDLGVLDVFRARDHGIPDYNTLREAYGLSRIESFTELTGEDTEEFPTDDPQIDINDPINDPSIMDYVLLQDLDGNVLELGSEAADGEAVVGVRRTTLAARLKAIYGDVDQVDAFVGMVSEPHLALSEFGALQQVMWEKQFQALRDGDANFYKWNKSLKRNLRKYRRTGLRYRQTLADVIVNNTDIEASDIQKNMFLAREE